LVFALVRMANNMPELFGTGYPRAGLLRRVGRLEQVAGVRLVTLGDGQGRGVRVLEFRTGTGFAFEVLIDRCFDVGRCELAGQPLSWLSGAGVTGPWYYEPDDWGWFRAWGGGMVVTCGLDHTLGPAEDTAAHFNQPHIQASVRYGLHGRAGGLPARLAGYGERWEGDECVLWAEGEVLQSAVFAEQLVLRRRIEARVGSSRFTIHDVVENTGHTPASHMFLYHCNAGFPVLDEGAELVVPSCRTSTEYGVPVDGYQMMSGPVRGATEACFEHELIAEAAGTVPVGLLNRARGLGVYQVFRIGQLPHHTVWRMLGEGTYALGLEPSTNRDAGRADARGRGELQWLEPGETRQYDLEIGALQGTAALDEFGDRVSRLLPAPPADSVPAESVPAGSLQQTGGE
jgi:Domain of unknown function (DUF4432)